MTVASVPTACGNLEFHEKNGIWEASTPLGTIFLRAHGGPEVIEKYARYISFPCARGETARPAFPRPTCAERTGYQVSPQFDRSTGRCWWTSLLAAITYSKHMRAIFEPAILERTSANVGRALGQMIRGNHERARQNSETLRRDFFERWNIGDSPSTPPAMEGRNAREELCKLCKALDVPVAVMHWVGKGFAIQPSPETSAPPRLLIVRVDRVHRPWLPSAELVVSGAAGASPNPNGTWRLQAALVGNEDANHQVSLSTCDGSVCTWMLADSDAAIIGVNAAWFSCNNPKDWVDMLRAQLPILVSGSASFVPVNTSYECTAEYGRCSSPGMTNVDFLYTRGS